MILIFNGMQDSSITVAFDDIPDEGLNSPLRLEKVANEVYTFFRSLFSQRCLSFSFVSRCCKLQVALLYFS